MHRIPTHHTCIHIYTYIYTQFQIADWLDILSIYFNYALKGHRIFVKANFDLEPFSLSLYNVQIYNLVILILSLQMIILNLEPSIQALSSVICSL